MSKQYITFSQLECVLEQMRKSIWQHTPCENQEEDAHTNEPAYSASSLWEMVFDEVQEKMNQLEQETKKRGEIDE